MMGSAVYFDRRIILSPLEQMYVATCDCVDNYMYSSHTKKWKERLLSCAKDLMDIEVGSTEILLPFPTLAYLICAEGLGTDWSLTEYFEGTDERSHNSRLRYMTKLAESNRLVPEDFIREIKKHSENCSVRIVKTDSSNLSDPFDINPTTEYVFTHGVNSEGRIIIREASADDLEKKRPLVWKNTTLQL